MKARATLLRLVVLLVVAGSLLPASQPSVTRARSLPDLAPIAVIQTAPPCAGTTAATVNITSNGPSPTAITVAAGDLVTWVNQTTLTQRLVIELHHLVYLPLIARSGSVMAAAQAVTPDSLPSAALTIDIPVGGSYAHTFSTEGYYSFAILTNPAWQGNVRVEPGTLPPDLALVAPALDLGVATNLFAASAFLYSGPSPIQTGVVSGTIAPEAVAVLRGKAITRDGAPLPDVTVSVHNHPEYGQTRSRLDGGYDLVVNGGGRLTLTFEKNCYLPAQRQIATSMQTQHVLPDVALLPADGQVTSIDLQAPGLKVARGSVVRDEDGTRQATLLFPEGITATLVLPDGATRPLTSLDVRLTEYTVGENGPAAMPAQLPPNSAYTYAFEATVDEALRAGAADVRFSRPVFNYVENFLDFPAGIVVPTGYYDRELAQWVASDSGVVIKILSASAGLANVDTSGDNQPEDAAALAALGFTAAELRQLASLYAPGTSLWRVPLPHFSTWDHNWPFGPPKNARPPTRKPPAKDKKPDKKCKETGSIIGCETQSLGEVTSLTGTPHRLYYSSDRMPGRLAANQVDIALSDSSMPTSTMRIDLEVVVAGRVFTETFTAAPNQSYTFTWDGLDAYGRRPQGPQPALVRVGNVYNGVYQQTERFGSNGDGIPITGDRTREEVTLWQEHQTTIGGWDARGAGLGGWTLDVQHVYDPVNQMLYLGDGEQRSPQSMSAAIATVAGTGVPGYSGDGGPALQAQLGTASDVAVGPDGSVFIPDGPNHRIRKIGRDGIITTVAGNGTVGFSGDGGPALQAQINPGQMRVGDDGSLYFEDSLRLRKVDPNGIITTIAGNGSSGYSGDGGPATQARFANLISQPAPDGSVYIADFYNQRIRRVNTDGIVTTVAGNGNVGYNGDGIPATQASVCYPTDLALDREGLLLIGDTCNGRIRRVGADGIITTIAGGGNPASGNGDGGPATEARLSFGFGVDMTSAADGSVYVTERGFSHVRRIGPDGIITTFAGNGTAGFSGDGGPALKAQLNQASQVAAAPDGSLYIGDTFNNRIRRVAPSLPGFGASDIAIPSEDGGELYQFDANGRHLRTLNTLTGAIRYRFEYDAAGLLEALIDGDGNRTRVERDATGAPVAIVGPYGQRTTLALDAEGFLSRVVDPAGHALELTSDAGGLLTSLRDPNGNIHRYTYDAAGRLSSDTNPLGGSSSLSRLDATENYSVTLQSALNRSTTYSTEFLADGGTRRVVTDPSGLRASVEQRPDGSTKQMTADGMTTTTVQGPDPRWGMQAPQITRSTTSTPGGLQAVVESNTTVVLANPDNLLSLTALTETVRLNARTTTRVYTAADRTWTSQTASGRQTRTTLDPQGRPLEAQIANFNPVRYTYDSRGRLISADFGSDASARTTSFAYDAQGQLATVFDALDHTTRFEYDQAGNLVGRILPDGRTIRASYDANGALLSTTPPEREAHTYAYDAAGRPTSYTAPAVGDEPSRTEYAYNADGDLTRVTHPDGQQTNLSYDNGGRLQRLNLPEGELRYDYDPRTGQLTTITTPGGQRSVLGYDGALTTSIRAEGAVAGETRYSYDTFFRVRGEQVNGASPVAYAYDDDGLLTQAGELRLTRDAANGLPTGTTLGNIADTSVYNNLGELSRYQARHNSTNLYTVDYLYDKLGRITRQVVIAAEVISTWDYRYDAAGRLVEVLRDGTSIARYTYDANDNRLQEITPGTTLDSDYDAQDRLTRYGTTAYTYSPNGDLLSKTTGAQTTAYRYDLLGNLLRVTLPSDGEISYLYDGENQRIGKLVDGQRVQALLYGGQGGPVAELDGNNAVASRFVYGSRGNLPDYIVKGATTYRIIADHLGSPRLVVDVATGTIAQRMDYDVWGQVLLDTNPGFQPFGFAGGLYDHQTGLVRLGARDYDAQTGRWTAKDPLRFESGDTNFYTYVLNDPVNRVDPTGLSWWDAFKEGVGGLDWDQIIDPAFFQSAPWLHEQPTADLRKTSQRIVDLEREQKRLKQALENERRLAKQGKCPDKKKHKKLNDRLYNVNGELLKLRDQYNQARAKIKNLHIIYDYMKKNSSLGPNYRDSRDLNFEY